MSLTGSFLHDPVLLDVILSHSHREKYIIKDFQNTHVLLEHKYPDISYISLFSDLAITKKWSLVSDMKISYIQEEKINAASYEGYIEVSLTLGYKFKGYIDIQVLYTLYDKDKFDMFFSIGF